MNEKPIDELVAEKVMGWIKPPETSILKAMWVETPIGAVHPQLPKFSENMQDAWLVVEKLQDQERIVKVMGKTEQGNMYCSIDGRYGVTGRSAPMAICIAALKAVGEEWQ
ncbi:BC1872 family protein [Bacillus thuringiensis]|uniref:BC1872 family protein n=1 Tax=Bacillus thuringiensis TaxID=1428 RepID=UPI000BF88240|nr:hypothetical protein [Bacillus thuringiensis]PER45290.1 hypothetical protein CN472_18215 [Bacillus thuringiensis]